MRANELKAQLIFPDLPLRLSGVEGAKLGKLFWDTYSAPDAYETAPKRVVFRSVLSIPARYCGGPQKVKSLVRAGSVDQLVHEARKAHRLRGINTLNCLAAATWKLE
eukprot:s491_g24.t1